MTRPQLYRRIMDILAETCGPSARWSDEALDASALLTVNRALHRLLIDEIDAAPCRHGGEKYSTQFGTRCSTCLKVVEAA